MLAVSVLFGDRRFTLRRTGVGQHAVAQVCHESGGVVLRTDEVGMDVWSRGFLAGALAGYARAQRRGGPGAATAHPARVTAVTGWTAEQFDEASIAELRAGRLPLRAQHRLATMQAEAARSPPT